MLAGCVDKEKENGDFGKPIPQGTPEVSTTPVQGTSGVSSSTSTILEKYDLKQLVSMSDNIIIGEVSEVMSSRWNTPDGKRPAIDNNDTTLLIYTDANIKIEESLKGSSNPDIVVRILGGIVEPHGQSSEDQPSYITKEKVLVFLKRDNDPRTKDVGGEHMTTAGLIQGKIPILQNNDVIIGGERMTLEDAKNRIKSYSI